jgi:predicted nucleic acid-binding protein
MICVVDTSLWVLSEHPSDPRFDAAHEVLPKLARRADICSPTLMAYEVCHLVFVKRKDPREDVTTRQARVQRLLAPLTLVPSDWATLGSVAETCGLSAYDATYLELATRLGAVLATEDHRLHQAGIRILGPGRAFRLAGLAAWLDSSPASPMPDETS